MVKHYNASISEDAARILNSKQGQFLGDDVQGPVATIELKPRGNIIRGNSSTGTGAITLFNAPSDKDFYITSLSLTVSKNATCDAATGAVNITANVDGVSQSLLRLAITTLVAEANAVSLSFDPPVKVDRSAAINVASYTFTAGAMCRTGTVSGYTVETTK